MLTVFQSSPPSTDLPTEVLSLGFGQLLLHDSLSGVMLLRPTYAADGLTIQDFNWAYLNPAAQQMLRLPPCPVVSFKELFPAGAFSFYCEAFASGQLLHRQTTCPHDGLNGYYLLAALRTGDVLLVSFAATRD